MCFPISSFFCCIFMIELCSYTISIKLAFFLVIIGRDTFIHTALQNLCFGHHQATDSPTRQPSSQPTHQHTKQQLSSNPPATRAKQEHCKGKARWRQEHTMFVNMVLWKALWLILSSPLWTQTPSGLRELWESFLPPHGFSDASHFASIFFEYTLHTRA